MRRAWSKSFASRLSVFHADKSRGQPRGPTVRVLAAVPTELRAVAACGVMCDRRMQSADVHGGHLRQQRLSRSRVSWRVVKAPKYHKTYSLRGILQESRPLRRPCGHTVADKETIVSTFTIKGKTENLIRYFASSRCLRC